MKKLECEVYCNRYTTSVAFSPDDKHLVHDGPGSMLTVWDVTTGKVTRRFAGRRFGTAFLGCTPDGKMLAAQFGANTVLLWDAVTGKRLGVFKRPRGREVRIGMCPGGKVLAWRGVGNVVELWDVGADKLLSPRSGHTDTVSIIAFAAGGREVISADVNGTVCFWDTAGRETRRLRLDDVEALEVGLERSHRTGVVSPDGKHLLTGDSSTLCLWELNKGHEVCAFAAQNIHDLGAAFSPDGELLAVAVPDLQTQTSAIRLYEVSTGEEVRRLPGEEEEIRSVAFSPDGKKVVAVGGTRQAWAFGQVRAWIAASGKQLWKVKRKATFPQAVVFAPDGRSVAVAEAEAVIFLDANSGKLLRRLADNTSFDASRVTFAPDSRTLAVFDYRSEPSSEQVVVWEIASGTVRQEFSGHEGTLSALAFSPDGRRLATGSSNNTVLLWDLTASGLPGKKLTAKELLNAWLALEVESGKTAFAAMGRLIAAPADALPLLEQQLNPGKRTAANDETIASWVADLEHRRFDRREHAMLELEVAGKRAEKALRKALEGKPTVELRRRVEPLLDKLKARSPTQERLRATRALEVLERIGTAEAKQLLETLAGGAPGAWLTEEAKASLRRLAPRAKAAP